MIRTSPTYNTVTHTIAVGMYPYGVAFTPDVCGHIGLGAGGVDRHHVGGGDRHRPPDGTTAHVANLESNTVSVIPT